MTTNMMEIPSGIERKYRRVYGSYTPFVEGRKLHRNEFFDCCENNKIVLNQDGTPMSYRYMFKQTLSGDPPQGFGRAIVLEPGGERVHRIAFVCDNTAYVFEHNTVKALDHPYCLRLIHPSSVKEAKTIENLERALRAEKEHVKKNAERILFLEEQIESLNDIIRDLTPQNDEDEENAHVGRAIEEVKVRMREQNQL